MSLMSDAITVLTSIGNLDVTIHGSGRASVRAEEVPVGKFFYRINVSLVADRAGDWQLEEGGAIPCAYRTDGKKYFEPAAPTIKAKIVAAARVALLRALADNPLAMVRADVENAKAQWMRMQNNLDELQKQVEVAQKKVNEAERAFYDALDRETAVELALQQVVVK